MEDFTVAFWITIDLLKMSRRKNKQFLEYNENNSTAYLYILR